MFVALIAATVLMADAASAAPTTTPAATAAAQPAKKADGQQMVCKTEQVIGSRLPVKKCRTAEQAAQEKADAREQLDKAQGAMANNPH
jgi:curli biogenesis system outer membrane secretion channel CsgG